MSESTIPNTWTWGASVNNRPRILPENMWSLRLIGGMRNTDATNFDGIFHFSHGMGSNVEVLASYMLDIPVGKSLGEFSAGFAFTMAQNEEMQLAPEIRLSFDSFTTKIKAIVTARLVYRLLTKFCIFADDRLEIDLDSQTAIYIVPIVLGYQVTKGLWFGFESDLFRFALDSDEAVDDVSKRKSGLRAIYSYKGGLDLAFFMEYQESEEGEEQGDLRFALLFTYYSR